jgi:hypothetical protein
VASERLNNATGFALHQSDFHSDSRRPQAFDSPSAYKRVGIHHRHHDAFDSGFNQQVRAGRRPTVMRARFQRDISRCLACTLTGLPDGSHLGMVALGVIVKCFSDDLAVLDEDTSDGWIGTGVSYTRPGQSQCSAHQAKIILCHNRSLPLSEA